MVSQNSEKEFECIIVELKGHNKELIGATYRPPNTDPHNFIKYYDELTKTYKHRKLTLGIDHNLDLIKSDKRESTQTYVELNFDRGLTPTITKPTRVTKTSATLIDNIFCSIDMLDYYESQILLTDMSDHFACLLFRGSVDKNESRTVQKMKLNEKTIESCCLYRDYSYTENFPIPRVFSRENHVLNILQELCLTISQKKLVQEKERNFFLIERQNHDFY